MACFFEVSRHVDVCSFLSLSDTEWRLNDGVEHQELTSIVRQAVGECPQRSQSRPPVRGHHRSLLLADVQKMVMDHSEPGDDCVDCAAEVLLYGHP